MARTKTRANYSNFAKGKVSDFNALYPVENAARTLLNVDIELNGKSGRRLGLEPETDFNLPVNVNGGDTTSWLAGHSLTDIQSYGIDHFPWNNVDNVPGLTYRVSRIGNTLYIYDEGGTVLSDNLVRTIDISAFATQEVDTAAEGSFSATSGKGFLICAGADYEPFYVKHNASANTWSTHQINIKIRDFEGVDDGLDIDDHPASLSASHRYNLLNQGWNEDIVDIKDDSTDRVRYNAYFNAYNTYPSNADIQYLGNSVSSVGNFEWDAELVKTADIGNTRAPSGHFIVNPFDGSSRQTVSGVGGLSFSTTNKRPQAVQFFAGRVWYGSVNGVIYFSKIIESERDLGFCYQQQDPTAEDINELLDTDGGTVPILDIGDVESMTTLNDSLVVLGTGGVWLVSGGDAGFTANRQLVANISKVSVTNYKSVVPTGNQVYFWSDEGIYVIQPDYKVESLSLNRIQKDYNKIPASGKATAQGSYDRLDNKIYWSFSYHTENLSTDIRYKYTDILLYSIPLNAFWDYRLSNEGFTQSSDNYPIMCGLFTPSFRQTGTSEEDVFELTGGLFFVRNADGSNTNNIYVASELDSFSPATTYEDDVDQVMNKATDANFLNIRNQSGGRSLLCFTQRTGAPGVLLQQSDDGGDNWTILNADITDGASSTSDVFYSKTHVAYDESQNVILIVTRDTSNQSRLFRSTDYGENFTEIDLTSNSDLDVIFHNTPGNAPPHILYDSNRGRFTAIPSTMTGTNHKIGVSDDGLTWGTLIASNIGDAEAAAAASDFFIRSVEYNAEDDYLLILAVDPDVSTSKSYVYLSPNGGSSWWKWREFTDASTQPPVTELIYNKLTKRYLLLYHPDVSASVAYADSVNFSVVVGTQPIISDNWITENYTGVTGVEYGGSGYLLNDLMHYSESYGKYILTPYDSSSTDLFIYTSDNGVDWTQSTSEFETSGDMESVRFIDSDITANVTEDGENVTVEVPFVQFASSAVKAAILLPDASGNLRLTFGQFSSRAFHDWDSLTQTDLEANDNYTASFPVAAMNSGNYASVIESLPYTLGEPSLQKQGTYIHVYFDYLRGGYGEFTVPDEFDTA